MAVTADRLAPSPINVQPRDDRTRIAYADHDRRLPTCEEQDWPDKPDWGSERWRSWD